MATVRIEDCRALKYCRSGVLRFLSRYGLSWRKLATTGLSEQELLGTENAFARKIVEHARQREKANGSIRRGRR